MNLTKPIIILFLSLSIWLCSGVSHAFVAPTALPMKTPMEAYRVNQQTISPEPPAVLAITFDMEADWYTYGNDPGGMGKPTIVTATTADGKALRVVYPTGVKKKDSFDPDTTINAYLNGTKVFLPLPAGAKFPLDIQIEMLLCHPTKCIPVKIDLTYGESGLNALSFPLADVQPWWPEFMALAKSQTAQAVADAAETEEGSPIVQWSFTPKYLQPGLEVAGVFSAILMGLLAGLVLNIMPCVLPVVSLKLTALLKTGSTESEEDRIARFREHNIYFSFGAISFFLFLAVILGATGQAWGALFQNRWLVLGLAGVVTALSLSLFGLFHLPVIDLKFGTGHSKPRTQAYFTGMLTTLLATPCSGPFLGGVLGWALVQRPLVIVAVFISIGVGMASPYLLMVLNPGLARFLPRSGPWIEYVEKGIGFFLLGTAFYLVIISLGGYSLQILAPLWVAIFGGWLWVRSKDADGDGTRWLIRIATVVLLIMTIVWTTPDRNKVNPWEPFDPVELSQRIGTEPLFIDFTADWCPTCKVLEATVLTDANVNRWKQKYGVAFIRVDMTERDPEAEALLKALGSMSIPTAAMFSRGETQSPLVLRDLYTESQLENILKSWKK